MRLRYPGVSKQLWSSWKLRWCMKSQRKWSESFWNGLGCTTCFGNTSRACVGEELSVTWARIPGKDGLCASAQAAVPHPKFSKLTQELAICLLEIPLNAVNTGDILDFNRRITKKKPKKPHTSVHRTDRPTSTLEAQTHFWAISLSPAGCNFKSNQSWITANNRELGQIYRGCTSVAPGSAAVFLR